MAIALPGKTSANKVRIDAALCLLGIKLIATALKRLVPERRPDDQNDESFPSEHAAQCVASAMLIEREYPGKIGSLAYGLASAVSLSRIEAKKHYPRDVLAGALIGATSVALTLRLRPSLRRRQKPMR